LGMPFYVVSNGLDSFIRPVLGDRVSDRYLYANRAVWRGPRLAVEWPYPCSPVLCAADCGLCKPTVMRWLTPPGQQSVLVGDGVTDMAAARRADVVIARDRLAEQMTAVGKPFYPFDDFHDVAAILESLAGGDS
jgi:2-hydroxy-3-keto-5-methylthiopentenyl-1-phosphate phosphatase